MDFNDFLMTKSEPLRQSLFHFRCFALKSPAMTLRPVIEQICEKNAINWAREAAGKQQIEPRAKSPPES